MVIYISAFKGAIERIYNHVYQTFDDLYAQRECNTTTEMLGKYVNNQMKFVVNLMPVYKHLEESTVPRMAEVKDKNDTLEEVVYVQQMKQYCNQTQVIEDNRS